MTAAVGALADNLPEVRRCSVPSTLLSGYRSRTPLYDHVAALWFDDDSGARAARQTDAFRTLRDHRTVERSSFGSIVAQDHVAKARPFPAAGVKRVRDGHPQAGDGPRGVPALLATGARTACVQDPHDPSVRPEPLRPSEYDGDNQPVWDGGAITMFDDTDSMRRSAEKRELAETRKDEPNFLALGHLPFIITTEVFPVGDCSEPVREESPLHGWYCHRQGVRMAYSLERGL
jgi:hypothetical protein